MGRRSGRGERNMQCACSAVRVHTYPVLAEEDLGKAALSDLATDDEVTDEAIVSRAISPT